MSEAGACSRNPDAVRDLWAQQFFVSYGGETGIRTLDTVSRIHAFQACAFSHSAISPFGKRAAEGPERQRCFIVTQETRCSPFAIRAAYLFRDLRSARHLLSMRS